MIRTRFSRKENTDIDYLVINNYVFDKAGLLHLKDKFAKGYKFASD